MWSNIISLYDTIANRISIEDVQAKDGRLLTMEMSGGEYDKLPHMLIAGGTGGGKTYFILTSLKPCPHQRRPVRVRPKERRPCGFTGVVAPDTTKRKIYSTALTVSMKK